MALADRSPAPPRSPSSSIEALRAIDQRFRPVTMADHHLLPVLDSLASLLPGGGLRRGSVVGVDGTASTSLALALVAEASGQGSWVAAVEMPDIGLSAASELGVALDRLALIPRPGPGTWPTVVAALVDAVDVVLLGPTRIRAGDARRVAARARERGAVLIPVGGQWPEAPDVTLTTGTSRWVGLGDGHGHLQAREVTVEAGGRREAARLRTIELLLPASTGGVEAVARPVTPIQPTALHSVG